MYNDDDALFRHMLGGVPLSTCGCCMWSGWKKTNVSLYDIVIIMIMGMLRIQLSSDIHLGHTPRLALMQFRSYNMQASSADLQLVSIIPIHVFYTILAIQCECCMVNLTDIYYYMFQRRQFKEISTCLSTCISRLYICLSCLYISMIQQLQSSKTWIVGGDVLRPDRLYDTRSKSVSNWQKHHLGRYSHHCGHLDLWHFIGRDRYLVQWDASGICSDSYCESVTYWQVVLSVWLITWLLSISRDEITSKHKTSKQWWLNVGPASETVAQH